MILIVADQTLQFRLHHPFKLNTCLISDTTWSWLTTVFFTVTMFSLRFIWQALNTGVLDKQPLILGPLSTQLSLHSWSIWFRSHLVKFMNQGIFFTLKSTLLVELVITICENLFKKLEVLSILTILSQFFHTYFLVMLTSRSCEESRVDGCPPGPVSLAPWATCQVLMCVFPFIYFIVYI